MNKFIRLISILLLFSMATNGLAAKKKKSSEKKKDITKLIISEQEQRKLDYYFYEAVRQRQLRNYDSAIDLLTECYYINPRNSAVIYEFATIYSIIQDVNHAKQYMALAAKLDQSNSWYKMGFAELCIKNNDYPSAIEAYEDIAENHPEKEYIDYMLASLYKRVGELNKSIESLNKVEKKIGISETISFEKYRLYNNLGEKDKANKEIDKIIKKFPSNMKYRLLRGSIYLDDGKPKKALKTYNEVKELEPNNILLVTAYYEYYIRSKDTVTANKQFEDAFKNSEISIEDKLTLLSQILSIENQSVKTAENYFNILMKQYDDNETLHSFYATFLLVQRRNEEAEIELYKILKINPKNEEAWMELIHLYAGQNDAEKMLKASDEAIKNNPQSAKFYIYKGLAEVQKEQTDTAINTYKKGLSLVRKEDIKTLAKLNMQIADLMAEQKNLDSAFVYYEEAYKSDPTDAMLLNNYAYYLSVVKKDLVRAESMSAQTIKAYPENVSFLDTYAWIFFQQGNYTLALIYIEQAMNSGGKDNPIVVEHYGDILFKNDRIEEAVELWKTSLSMGNKTEKLLKKIATKTYIEE